MSYSRTTWIPEETPLSADNFNNIEDGIEELMAQTSSLDNQKVDKVTGKGLSTNDYTTAEKNKLAGIAAGATANTVTNSLTSTSTTAALSAAQGKALNDNKAAKSDVYAKGDIVTLTGSTNVAAEGIAAWNLNLPSNVDPSKVMLLSVEQRRESGSAIGPWLQAGNIVHNNNAYPACSINESSKLLILNLYANFSSGTLRYRVRYIVL